MNLASRKKEKPVQEQSKEKLRTLAPTIALFSLCLVVASWGPEVGLSVRSIWGYAGLTGLASAIGLSASRIEAMKKLVVIDGLTGLANRSFLDDVLGRELSRASRHHEPLSVLIADIDHFKHVNDSYGHATGDRVLKAVAQAIRVSCRSFDTAGRYGGEEFVIVLPQTNSEGACQVAERIRLAVESLTVPFLPDAAGQENVRVTISIGIARFPDDGVDRASLIRHADEHLYLAKLAGRNRVSGTAEPIEMDHPSFGRKAAS